MLEMIRTPDWGRIASGSSRRARNFGDSMDMF